MSRSQTVHDPFTPGGDDRPMTQNPMKKNVETAMTTPSPALDAPDLLLRHCLALGAVPEPREPASIRLEEALGPELATRLLSALTPHPRTS
jgi:hypothetical protein